MNIQERIEALETEFNAKIKALKAEVQREDEFPQYGQWYWHITSDAGIGMSSWEGFKFEKDMLSIGNVYQTENEAVLAVEKLKVEAELQKFGRPFEYGVNCTEFYYDHEFGGIMFCTLTASQTQGAIYFESREKAEEAVKSVGEERIKKYLFGVED